MGEQFWLAVPLDRAVEQMYSSDKDHNLVYMPSDKSLSQSSKTFHLLSGKEIARFDFDDNATVSMKKGAYLLKCRRKGKPKFCPFRLSMDEKYLIWYSGDEEKQLKLSTVLKIVPGQKTLRFQRQLHPAKESQSFSLIYSNGERSLDLICKDKAQADSWFVGLKAVISRNHSSEAFDSQRSKIQSCVSSPAGFIRRKHNLGLLEGAVDFSQMQSMCSSPSFSVSDRCLSDGLSHSSNSFHPSDSITSDGQGGVNSSKLYPPCSEPNTFRKRGSLKPESVLEKSSNRFIAPTSGSPLTEKKEMLKDVMIWGEGIEGGLIAGGAACYSSSHDGSPMDALLPKVLESTVMLNVESVSLGGKHAALVTKQGDLFCWGKEEGGRLGHKINMDVNRPKMIDSLSGISKSVVCGEYQTCALTHTGEVFTWGNNSFGGARNPWLPCKLSGQLDGISIINVACGEWHIAIVSSSGRLFTYGDGTFGVLGHGDLQSIDQPKEVESLRGLSVTSVACGSWHTAAIVEVIADGFKFKNGGRKLFTWGDGDRGRLGHADDERKLLPTCISRLLEFDFVQVSCGIMLTVGLTNAGKVCTMGSSIHGQLGNPESKDKSITIVEGRLKEEVVKAISSGSYHISVLTLRGTVYAWGKNSNGQLGLGDVEDRTSPVPVEALRNRQVESITCGSNFTAAICLHKSVSSNDQSTCNGCKLPFGFTRKKHNCYNCGLLFCRTCSGKKTLKASLAPNNGKAYRVCDSCFHKVQRLEREEGGIEASKYGQIMLFKRSCEAEIEVDKAPKGRLDDEKEWIRWGQVPCPVLFNGHSCRESLFGDILPSDKQASDEAKISSESPISGVVKAKKCTFKPNELLNEELKKLRAEARSLEAQCQIRGEKIKEFNDRIKETWSIARDEAAKCKAAKEVIEALALRLHAMSEKAYSVSDLQNSPCSERFAEFDASSLPPEIHLPTNAQVDDSLSNSPIVFSDTIKSLVMRNPPVNRNGLSMQDPETTGTASKNTGTKDSKCEWIEQFEPGVYLTFTTLAGGKKGLKRVRFSRRRFSEKEAEKWWETKQMMVYRKYDIEGYMNSS